ncbi:hypothetical protein Psuf_083550 [Phytohabitans suffuscus]|uniref:Uncharacterized protein n=1 Tax=Phytohabitans suffuscus TaxID=624315 RepID=A0A6F8YY92_9ACTN|nr:hypothetical protein Psuf_083550 [Phytohabitans suffuscus]
MLPAEHVEELSRALAAVEALVAVRWEERRGGTGPERLLARPLPLTGPEGLPPATAFAGSGPSRRWSAPGTWRSPRRWCWWRRWPPRSTPASTRSSAASPTGPTSRG